jgi:hypothetical protein
MLRRGEGTAKSSFARGPNQTACCERWIRLSRESLEVTLAYSRFHQCQNRTRYVVFDPERMIELISVRRCIPSGST